MTDIDRNEIRVFWTVMQQLSAARMAGDARGVGLAIDEIATMARRSENPRMQHRCEDALARYRAAA